MYDKHAHEKSVNMIFMCVCMCLDRSAHAHMCLFALHAYICMCIVLYVYGIMYIAVFKDNDLHDACVSHVCIFTPQLP
jgi:hypothetical protein